MADAKPIITVKHRARTLEITSDWKRLGPLFKKAAVALNDQITAGDTMGMKESCRTMPPLLDQLSSLAGQAGFIQKAMTDLKADKDFVDPAGQATVIFEQMSAVAEAAGSAFAAGKRMLEKAERAIDTAEKGGADFETKWAKALAYLNVHIGFRTDALKEMLAIVAAAEKAVAARDAKGLEKAQKDAAGFARFAVPMSRLNEIADLRQASIADAPEADRKSYEADMKSIATRLRGATADEARISMERDAIAQMKIEPRDAKKAATVLGIASGDVPKLAKVLDAEPSMLMKGLEILRKQLALAMPAKEMMLALQKARLV